MTIPVVIDRRPLAPRLRLNAVADGHPDRVVRRGDVLTLEWKDSGVQCVMEPEEDGNYRFSSEVVRHSSWIRLTGKQLVVAGVLTFRIVGSREVFVNGAIFVTYLARLEATA